MERIFLFAVISIYNNGFSVLSNIIAVVFVFVIDKFGVLVVDYAVHFQPAGLEEIDQASASVKR